MTGQRYFVGLDVGGTTMKAAVVDDAGRPPPRWRPWTPTRNSARTPGWRRCARPSAGGEAAAGLTMADVAAIGVATPGLMDIKAGLILDPPNLKPWKNVPVRDHIQKAFGKPTAFQNDANAAAFGEFWVGAARGARSMVMFTLGTGVGGGGHHGRHGHRGRAQPRRGAGPPADRPARPRPAVRVRARGCLEAYASATNGRPPGPRGAGRLARARPKLRQYQTANDDKSSPPR
jgi:glucokinase